MGYVRKIRKIKINTFSKFASSKIGESILLIFLIIRYLPKIIKNLTTLSNTIKVMKSKSSIHPLTRKALLRYSLRQLDVYKNKEYLRVYQNQNVIPIQRKISSNLNAETPILICAVKNDLNRVKMQVNHHKMLGITNFVYIDNMSDDGTFEWLVQQGLDVFRVSDKFSATAKNAWIRQITDIYGYDRWYLILDSDELFVYPGMEDKNINHLINFAKREGIFRFQSFMIDMYPKGNIFMSEEIEIDLERFNIRQEYCFFDTNSYYVIPSYKGNRILGGPRSRVFSKKDEKFNPLLTKNPLVFLNKDDIFSIHYSIPYYKNFNIPIMSGILHFKFLPTDYEKYKKIVEQGNYAGGSAEYKQYLKVVKEKKNLRFYYNNSQRFNSSFDLLKINIIDKHYCGKFIYD